MENSILASYIELASIISATGFGILAAATETKNREGKLTKWGIIAILGILISSSISFTQNYLSQVEENKRFQDEVSLLKSIISKTDSSTITQRHIQKQTQVFANKLNSSIKNQKEIYNKTDQLLNPFWPFAVGFQFSMKVNPPTRTWIKDRDSCINGAPSRYLRMLNETEKGGQSESYYHDGWHTITPKLCDFEEIFSPLEIHVKFYSKKPKVNLLFNQDNCDLYVVTNPQKKRPSDTLEYSVFPYQEIGQYFYFKQEDGKDLYEVVCRTDIVKVISNTGVLKSISDLKKSFVVIYISTRPHCLSPFLARGEMRLRSFEFYFPPIESNVHEMEVLDDGAGYGEIHSLNRWE